MNILFCINKNCIFPTKILISSLEDTQKETLNIYIAHKELSKADIEDIKFAIDESKTTITDIQVDTNLFDGFPVSKRFPVEVYFRLFAQKFLPETLDRVLYLDVDTIVLNSLNELYYSTFNDKYIISMPHEFQNLEVRDRIRLQLPLDAKITNSGVLMLNLEVFRKNDLSDIILDFINKNRNILTTFDQDILNVVFQNYMKFEDYKLYNLNDIHIDYINKINKGKGLTISPNIIKGKSVIIHYFGDIKPWNSSYNGMMKPLYKACSDSYWGKYEKIIGRE